MQKTKNLIKLYFSFSLLFFFLGLAFVSTAGAEVILTLVNSNNNHDLYELDNNTTINLNNTGRALNIRADFTAPPSVVRFYLNGSLVRTEQKAPYSIGGDTNGNYNTWTPAVRTHTLRVTSCNASGGILDQRSIHFTVIAGGANTYQASRGDIVSLHYDMSPDPDDGHSAAADVSIYKKHKFRRMVVLGTLSKYGSAMNSSTFHEASQPLFRSVYGSDWYNAYTDWNSTVIRVADRWRQVLNAGGHVWIKEGGPSDFTADVIHRMQNALGVPAATTKSRIHLIQHGNPTNACNEVYTHPSNLSFVKNNTRYEKLANGNLLNATAGLNSNVYLKKDRDSQIVRFRRMAYASSSAAAWQAAFHFWNPLNNGEKDTFTSIYHPYHRLDFSDTVELLRILGIDKGKVKDCATFANYFFN